MFTIRILWSDGFDPSVYEQSFLVDAPIHNAQAVALRRARKSHKLFGGGTFQLLMLAVCPDDSAWSLMTDAARAQYIETCRMAGSL